MIDCRCITGYQRMTKVDVQQQHGCTPHAVSGATPWTSVAVRRIGTQSTQDTLPTPCLSKYADDDCGTIWYGNKRH
jgi:hypothetical protein